MLDLADVLSLTYICTRGVCSSSRAHKNSKFNKQRVFVYQTRHQHVYGSALGDHKNSRNIEHRCRNDDIVCVRGLACGSGPLRPDPTQYSCVNLVWAHALNDSRAECAM